MQVPRPQNRPVTPNSAPNVKVGGGTVTGEHFGSAYWRDIQRAAQGGQQFGEALLAEEQRRQQKEDEASAMAAYNASLQRASSESQAVLNEHRGGKAGEAPAAMEKMLRTIYDDTAKGLKNQHQKEAFERQWGRYQAHFMDRTYGWRDKETETFRVNGLKSSIELEKANAAETILDPDARGLFFDSLARVNTTFDEVVKDMPPEQAELYRRATLEDFHTRAINSLATQGPGKVLEYLDSEMAREGLPKATAAALREKYKKVEDTNQEIAVGRTLSDMRGESGIPLSFTALYDEALKEFPDDQDKAYKAAQFAVNFQAGQARERRSLDEEAMRVMAKSGWDIAAIDPNWPEDLQDKMQDRVLKHEEAAERREDRLAKAERRAKGLEYLEMPLDQLNKKILAGEWMDIVEDVGAGTPEHSKLQSRLKGEDAGGQTMLQYAKNEFTRIVGNPNTKKKEFAEFIQKVEEARTGIARKLKLDNPDMIPGDEQKNAIDALLVSGDYRWYDWSGYLSPNQYRFEVDEAVTDGWRPYDAPVAPTEDIPSFAQPYLGPRDARREVLANGNVLIESSNGTITIVKPDGSLLNAVSKGTK